MWATVRPNDRPNHNLWDALRGNGDADYRVFPVMADIFAAVTYLKRGTSLKEKAGVSRADLPGVTPRSVIIAMPAMSEILAPALVVRHGILVRRLVDFLRMASDGVLAGGSLGAFTDPFFLGSFL
jgi:hypothetical protein